MSLHDEHRYALISLGKYRWWCTSMAIGSMAVPKIGALLTLMSRIPRPNCPGESLLAGYIKHMKFRNGEQDLLVDALLSLDPTFFENYLTRGMRATDRVIQKRACGEAALAFLGWRNGFQTNGTPAVTPDHSYDVVMEEAITRAQAHLQNSRIL
jgi:hypothetical protein